MKLRRLFILFFSFLYLTTQASVLNYTSLKGSAFFGNIPSGKILDLDLPFVETVTFDVTSSTLIFKGFYFKSIDGSLNDIDVSKITIIGQGGGLGYTLSPGYVDIAGPEEFSVTLSGTDLDAVKAILNHNGNKAWDKTIYQVKLADDWCVAAAMDDITDASNDVSVTGYAEPKVLGANYYFDLGQLLITGENFQAVSGDNNDITTTRITITDGYSSYPLKWTPDVEITNNSSATLTLSEADRVRINYILNQNGIQSRSNGLYKIQVEEGWNGTSAGDNVGQNITVANYIIPQLTSVSFNASISELIMNGSNFASFGNSLSDIAVDKITITGGDGLTPYTLKGTYTIKLEKTDIVKLQLTGDDNIAVRNLLNKDGDKSFQGITYSITLADDWNAPVTWESTQAVISPVSVSGVVSPIITDANYNFSTGELNISGQNFVNLSGDDIDVNKIEISDGANKYTLTSATSGAEIIHSSLVKIVVSGIDRAKINYILNKEGDASISGGTYNIAAFSGWNGVGEDDLLNNPITVTNHNKPSIASVTYDASTGVMSVVGENFVSDNNSGNDIDVQKLTVSRGVTVPYTISSATSNVEVLSHNNFSLTVDPADKDEVNKILNWNGNKSYNDSIFYLSASDNWNATADASFDITDTKNSVIVSNVPNYPPVVENVALTGELFNGKMQIVTYSFKDLEGNLEGETEFRWYSYSDASGSDKTLISDDTSGIDYRLMLQDIDRYINVEITPVAAAGTPKGTPVASLIVGPVQNNAPVASSVNISGQLYLSKTAIGVYTYTDFENNAEGTSIYKWYRADDINGANEVLITGANEKTYVISNADIYKYISFEVTPVASSGKSTGVAVRSVRYLIQNSAPVATQISITEAAPFKVELVLHGKYNYFDQEGDSEAGSSYNWYKANDASGTGKSLITGANTRNYVVQTGDIGKYFSFEVIPVASSGSVTGSAVASPFMGPVVNSAPVATNITITGTQAVCQTLTGGYTYDDADGDAEGATEFRWLRADTKNGIKTAIPNATGQEYTLTVNDQSKFIFFEVTPRAITGNQTGIATVGNSTGAIVNLLPTVTFLGTASICSGSSTKLTISFTGSSPWKLVYSDGIKQNTIISSNPVYLLDVNKAGTFKGDTLIDNLGCPVTELPSTATINIKPIPQVEIVGLNNAYNIRNNPVPLVGTPAGGTFSGPGVVSSTNMFYPSIAGTQNSPHSIIYSYTSPQTSCTNKDTVTVEIIDAEASISGIRSALKYCNYDNSFIITGTNDQGSVGSFTINGGVGLTDNGNNTATIKPALLPAGDYTISYSYFKGVLLTVYKQIKVEVFQEPVLTGLNADSYCGNTGKMEIKGNITEGIFTGTCITYNAQTAKYYFDPSLTDSSKTTITYAYKTSYGCNVAKSLTKLISPVPKVDFKAATKCYNGDSTVFKNLTKYTSPVTGWEWGFGDTEASASDNSSTLFEPKHKYSSTGKRSVRLIAGNAFGCKDTLETIIHLGDYPKAAFISQSDCYVNGIPSSFKNSSTSIDPVVSYYWNIEDTSKMNFKYSTKDVLHAFPVIKKYTIKLKVATEFGCADSIKKVISLRPIVYLKDTFYSNTFEKGKGFWDNTDTVSTNNWYFGLPQGSKIKTASSGNNAFYIKQNNARTNQQLVVNSPCFDFTGIKRPFLSLSTNVDATTGLEGAVLQYSTDEGITWENVGGIASGKSWYNDYAIQSQPGGQQMGWSGQIGKWNAAGHNIDFLTDKQRVRFRFVFGENSKTTGTDGFAFDDFYIGSRNKYLLLEHFTNNSQAESVDANVILDNVAKQETNDVIDIQYHTSFPGTDTFNIHNPSDPGSRVLYYGIGVTPFSLLEGGAYIYDYVNKKPNGTDIKVLALKSADYSLSIKTNKATNKITGSVDVKAWRDLPGRNMSLKIVVVEDIISQSLGKQIVYKNVVKRMLPSAGGEPITHGWTANQIVSIDFNWDYLNVYNSGNLHVVAFLQDESSREIYQVASNDSASGIISDVQNIIESDRDEVWNMIVYPNPANEIVYFDFPQTETNDLFIQVVSLNGKGVFTDKIFKGVSRYELNTSDFMNGIYLIQISNKTKVLATKKLVIVH